MTTGKLYLLFFATLLQSVFKLSYHRTHTLDRNGTPHDVDEQHYSKRLERTTDDSSNSQEAFVACVQFPNDPTIKILIILFTLMLC